ncbi:gliding motility-associated C-terminal domain-containing protein [Spirosoma linguale]
MLLLVTQYALAFAQPVTDTCQHPEPPVIIGSAKFICRNEPVTLTATGCTGTVVWSNGETGSSIQVKPQQTTKYTAICRARPGCISCFADVWKITVNTPEPPQLTTSANVICPGSTVTLTATNCAGIIHWPDQSTGSVWVGKPAQTTTFHATCEQENCVSNPSRPVSVQMATPVVPVLSVSNHEICMGQPVQLSASGCLGTVRWTDGGKGALRTVTPEQTSRYRAVCELGSCRSDSSGPVSVRVRPMGAQLVLKTNLSNGCPFQTADLSKAIAETNAAEYTSYQFRMGPTLASAAVQSPGAVSAGTYFIFGRNTDGCYTNPVAVMVNITNCPNAIPACLSNPPTLAVRLDSLDWTKGVVRMAALPGGSTQVINWQSDGGGLFTDTGLVARYLLSEIDRQRGKALFTLSTPDPDGDGPCRGASVQQTVMAPPREIIGLSKKVSEPIWLTEKGIGLVELTYQLTVVNAGKHSLTNINLADDLDAAFSASGAIVRSVRVHADSGFIVNPAYTGRGADTTLLMGGSLAPEKQAHSWLTVQVDVSRANTLTFINRATVQGVDTNGMICRDRSTNGMEADPDKNGDPGDNDEPTLVTLHSILSEQDLTLFIPEGFSPNGDGINDRFVIKLVPASVTVQLEVFNRWGHLVYQNTNYQNDWDGTANQGISVADSKNELPDGTYYYQIRLSDGREYVRFLTLAR